MREANSSLPTRQAVTLNVSILSCDMGPAYFAYSGTTEGQI